MRRRYTSRPAPAASAFAAVVGVFILLFGIVMISKAGAKDGMVGLFLVVWVVVGIGIVIYHVANATRDRGVPTEIIEAEDVSSETKTNAERLQELEGLRQRQLISDAEFESKRQEILKGL